MPSPTSSTPRPDPGQLTSLHIGRAIAGDDGSIAWLVERTLMRPVTPRELSILTEGFNEQHAHYKADVASARQLIATGTSKPDAALDPAELAAWTMTASTLINLDEFINKP